MTYSKAQKIATAKYVKKTLDDIKVRVPKGKRSDYYQRVSAIGYRSFNQFAIQAFDEKLEREEKNKK